MNRFFIFIVVFLQFFWYAQAQQTDSLYFEQCIQIGISNNYGIRIVKNSELISGNNATYGKAGFLPVVYGKAGINSNSFRRINEYSDNITPAEQVNGTTGNRFAQIQADWTVFDGFAMFAQLQQLNNLAQQSRLQTRYQIENTVAIIGAGFYNVIQQKLKTETLLHVKKLSYERLQVANERYRIGKESKLEYQQALVDFNSDSSRYLTQIQNYELAVINLKQTLALLPDSAIFIKGSIEIDSFPAYDSLLAMTMVNNTELLMAQNYEQLSEHNLRISKAQRYPAISLSASYTLNSTTFNPGEIALTNQTGLNAGVSVYIPIFNGLNTNRQIQNAKLMRENAILESKQTEMDIVSNLKAIYLTYQMSLKRMNLELSNMQYAKNNFELATERYLAGSLSGIEMRDIQRSYLDAEDRLLAASYVAKMAEISLKQITGTIQDYMN